MQERTGAGIHVVGLLRRFCRWQILMTGQSGGDSGTCGQGQELAKEAHFRRIPLEASESSDALAWSVRKQHLMLMPGASEGV